MAAPGDLPWLGYALLPATAHQAVGVTLLQRLQGGGDGGRVGGRRRLEASEQGRILPASEYGNGSARGRPQQSLVVDNVKVLNSLARLTGVRGPSPTYTALTHDCRLCTAQV